METEDTDYVTANNAGVYAKKTRRKPQTKQRQSLPQTPSNNVSGSIPSILGVMPSNLTSCTLRELRSRMGLSTYTAVTRRRAVIVEDDSPVCLTRLHRTPTRRRRAVIVEDDVSTQTPQDKLEPAITPPRTSTVFKRRKSVYISD